MFNHKYLYKTGRMTFKNPRNERSNIGIRRSLFAVLAVLFFGITSADAQSAAVKDVAQSVFILTTYSADGKVIATSHGVFIGDGSEAVSTLAPFDGAARAVVTDANGNDMDVTRIIGINSLYDVARFRVSGNAPAVSTASSSAKPGATVWLVLCPSDGKKSLVNASVRSVETFMDKYSYYILAAAVPENGGACPFVNDDGEVIGLMQPSSTSSDVHAVDIHFISSLEAGAFAYSNANMQKTAIPAALPNVQSQAQVMLMTAGQGPDTLKYEAAIEDFIAQYPTLTDGYMARAQLMSAHGLFEDAASVMDDAVNNAADKADAHFNYARLIYDKLTTDSRPYELWTLDKAMEHVNAACDISPQPMYEHLKAQIYYSKGEYQTAYDMFSSLCADKSFNVSELLFDCAQCKQMLGAPNEEVLALVDSAVNSTDTMRMNDAAPYFLLRADVYNAMGRYRDAVFDYTRYAVLTPQMPSAQFYFIKEQAEVKGKMYKQALDDIARAILLAPNEPMYMAEMSSLYLHVNQPDKALQIAEKCVEIAPDYGTGHVLHGLALIKNGQQEEGMAALAKARDLGDAQAQKLIDKYSQ